MNIPVDPPRENSSEQGWGVGEGGDIHTNSIVFQFIVKLRLFTARGRADIGTT